MGKHVRNIGLVLIATWAVLLLVIEYHGLRMSPHMPTIASAGSVMVVGGILLQLLGRAGRAVKRPHCARCRQPIQRGETYCPEHFHEAIDRIKDGQEWGA